MFSPGWCLYQLGRHETWWWLVGPPAGHETSGGRLAWPQASSHLNVMSSHYSLQLSLQ